MVSKQRWKIDKELLHICLDNWEWEDGTAFPHSTLPSSWEGISSLHCSDYCSPRAVLGFAGRQEQCAKRAKEFIHMVRRMVQWLGCCDGILEVWVEFPGPPETFCVILGIRCLHTFTNQALSLSGPQFLICQMGIILFLNMITPQWGKVNSTVKKIVRCSDTLVMQTL